MTTAMDIENLPLPTWVCSRFDAHEITTSAGGENIAKDTRFPLASVTKTFTSHLCLGEGFREKLDIPIREILPYFKLSDSQATAEMTPRDALCHFSGLAPHTADWVQCELSREAYIKERLPRLPLEGPIRQKHRYSNIMYAVLGQWLEEIDGRTWEELVSEEILNPLGMSRTTHIDETWGRDAAPPHGVSAIGKPEPIPPFFAKQNHLIAPASELIGSMPDLAKWGQFLLSIQTEDDRWKPHSCITRNPRLDYGLGWRLDRIQGEPRYWHSGQCSGYTTLLTLNPHRKNGLALATNRSDAVDILMELSLFS
ncbi:serine hydrolase [Kiritimatiellaeota bacterium B1221]|nr:serine hydrolase [Kiritimatiellaeota bacterium B1221]